VLCLLPVGSYEQHGPHLPPTVDAEVAVYIAKRLAEVTNGVVLPAVYYTCSTEHQGFPHTISVKCTTFIQYLEDLLRSATNMCERVVIVVGHGGVAEAVTLVAQQLNYELGPRFLPLPVWRYVKVRDHAGTDETSVYLAIGGAVGKMEEVCEGDVSLFGVTRVSAFSKTGIVGCLRPAEVSAERGRALLEEGISRMAKKIAEFIHISSQPPRAP